MKEKEMSEENKESRKSVSLNLNAVERNIFGGFIPEEGSMLQMLIAKTLKDKISITAEELVALEFREEPGRAIWNPKLALEHIVTFDFTETELKVLKDSIDKLSEKNKLTLENVELANKIKELKVG